MRLPPQNIEMEQAVLGAIMLEKGAFHMANGILTANDFYTDQNKAIYGAFCSLQAKGSPIDLMTVTVELKGIGKLSIAGGATYLSELTERVASGANIEYHAKVVKQEAIKRALITLCTDIAQQTYDGGDAFELIDKVTGGVIDINMGIQSQTKITLKSAVDEEAKVIARLSQNPDVVQGIPTGFKELDKETGGWQRGNHYVIAGRPGMGKSVLVTQIALTAIENGARVLFNSLEMPADQIARRVISYRTQINNNKFKDPKQLTTGDLRSITSLDESDNLIIDDTASMTVERLHSSAKAMHMEQPLDMVIVDYLQLMSSTEKGNREQQVSAMSRGLKNLAKDLNVPVIDLSQLSRSVETRGGDKRPILSDLRESGGIEQDADAVIFIYRPEYYDITEYEDGQSTKGVCELIIAKNRHGALDTVKVKFDGATSTMCDFEDTFQDTFKQPASFRAEQPTEDDIPF